MAVSISASWNWFTAQIWIIWYYPDSSGWESIKNMEELETDQNENFRPEDIVFGGHDDGLVADVVVEILFDPFGIVTSDGVVSRPESHSVVLLNPKEESSS